MIRHQVTVFTWYSFSFISLATLSVNLASEANAGFCGAELLWPNQSVNASWASYQTNNTQVHIISLFIANSENRA